MTTPTGPATQGTANIAGGPYAAWSGTATAYIIGPSGITVPIGGGGAAAISAGASSQNTGTVVFSNSNGVSFGMNNGVVTATVTPGAAAGIAALQVSNTTYTSGTAIFSNANGITFGSSAGGGVTASYNSTQFAGTGTTFNGANISGSITHNSLGINLSLSGPVESGVGIAAVGSTITGGTVSFSNSNGVTFGMNGSTITASVAAAGGAQTGISSVIVSNTTYTSGAISFSNANGITFGSSAGQAITASYNSTQFAGTGTTFGGTNVSGSMTLNSAGLVLSLSGGAGGAGGVGIQVSNTTYTSGTITFQNANGISFGSSGAAGVSASYTVPSTAGLISGMRFSAGGGTSNTAVSGMTFSNSNGITFGLSTGANVGTLTASYNSTQFAGTGTTFGGTNISGSVTLNSNGLVLSLSGGAGGGGVNTGTFYVQSQSTNGSSGTIALSSLNFAGYGLVSVGVSNGTVQISGPATTSFAGFALSGAGSSQSAGTIVFSNSNGVSFGMNGSTITASAAGGGGGVNIAASNSTFTSGTVVLSAAGGALTISNGAQSALFSVPATSSLVGTNGISISSNGNTISVSHVNQSIYVVGNTTGQSSSSYYTPGALTISAVGAVSIGWSAGVLIIS